MAIDTAEEFFAVLEKSRLLTAEQLAACRRSAGEDDDPTAIAKILAREELLTRWQAGQLLAGRSSFFLGKYKLIELLGRGGMGSVFLGEHVKMNRRVALKILARQIGKDPDALERFLSEARAIAALDHPNIVRAYSVDTEGGRYFIVMEYVDGQNLQQMVDAQGPLDFKAAADHIRQAADGLAHGHQQNMIHCDIKPSNLLVNRQGVVKIVDMGLARLGGADPEESNGQDERVLGSVDYLAPEQAVEGPDFDHRADIYSLGCTLYFLLTGHPPFPEGTLPERILKHQTEEPRSIIEQRPQAPPDLVQICRTMMAKQPDDRFRSAEQISRILAEWRPPPPPKRKPAAVLRTAEPLGEPAEEGLPSISISDDSRRRSPSSFRAKPKRGAATAAGLPAIAVRRRIIIAAGVALLAAVVVAVIALLSLSGSAPKNGKEVAARADSPAEAGGPQQQPSEPAAMADSMQVQVVEQPPTNKPKPQKPPEKPAEKPPEKPAEKPAEKPTETPPEKPPEKPAEKPAEKPPEKPAEKPPDNSPPAKKVEPLVIDLDSGSAKVTLPADSLPKTGTLKLQITRLEGAFPKHEFRPGEKMLGDTIPAKGVTTIFFVDEKLPEIRLGVQFDVKVRTAVRTARVKVVVYCQLPGQRPKPFRAREAARLGAKALAMQKRMQFAIGQLKDENRKKEMQQQLDALNRNVVEPLKALDGLYKAINKTGKIHFRVFTTDGDRQVDLFRTEAKTE